MYKLGRENETLLARASIYRSGITPLVKHRKMEVSGITGSLTFLEYEDTDEGSYECRWTPEHSAIQHIKTYRKLILLHADSDRQLLISPFHDHFVTIS